MSHENLTGKQRLFVDAYIGAANCNASEAARIAGYSAPAVQGYENLKKPHIRTAIDQRMRELTIPPEEILFRLTQHARGNIRDVVGPDGRLPASLDGLTREQAALIKKHSAKQTRYGEAVAVELHDAQSALLALAKRYGLFPEKHEHSGAIRLEDVLGSLDPETAAAVSGLLAAAIRT